MKKDNWILNSFIEVKADILAAIAATIITYALQLIIALFAMVVYNKIIPNGALETLITATGGILILVISDTFFKFLRSRININQNRYLESKLANSLYGKIIAWDLQSVPKLPGGSSLLLRDLETVVQLFGAASLNLIVGLPFVFIFVFAIYLLAGSLVYVTITGVILTLLINLVFFKFLERASENAKEAIVEKNAAFIETLNNLEGIKSLASYKYFDSKWTNVDQAQGLTSDQLARYMGDASTAAGFVSSVCQVAILAFGAFLILDGDLSPGALIAGVLLHGRAQQPLQGLLQFLLKLSVARVAIKRISGVLSSQSNEDRRRQNIKVASVKGPISIKDLEFSPREDGRSILSVPILRLENEQKIGILGSVGSGKSTFVKLISGVLTPTTGSVSYGNYDTTAIDQENLRSSVAYLGQQPSIFSGTIRDNIALGKLTASDEEIEQAMALSGFDKVLRGFPNGLSFSLSEGGRELSGGQKQILALTRTLLSNPNVIVLDEPTSAMDPRHEVLFIRRMTTFIEGRTFVVVTHRRPILSLVDRILVIEGGKIVMDGARDDVLKKFS